jgi:hypothetical protein
MSTREAEEHLREMYGVEISPQFVSRATEPLQAEITEWQTRPLESVYPVVYVDGLRVSVRSGNNSRAVIKKCIYIVLGISCSGNRTYWASGLAFAYLFAAIFIATIAQRFLRSWRIFCVLFFPCTGATA